MTTQGETADAGTSAEEAPPVRVLLVEDEDRIASFIAKGLGSRGFVVDRAATGADVDERLAAGADVMVLDLGLPDEDGIDVLTRLRARGELIPIVILSARGEVEDRVSGLDLGADDYVAKPFSIDELAARLRTRVKPPSGEIATKLRAADIELDLVTRVVSVGEREVELTAREFTLLETMMREPDRAHPREELLERVWGLTFDPRSNLVDVYVRYLRKKLGSTAIKTVRGVGYAITPPPPSRRRRTGRAGPAAPGSARGGG